MESGDVADEVILEAVAGQEAWIDDLLVRLVAVPTVLGNEEAGQQVMDASLREIGLEPVDVAMDAAALRAHPQAAPFDWDVAGKRNLVATWGGGDGRSLILNGHIDVVTPEPLSRWGDRSPFEARIDDEWQRRRHTRGVLRPVLRAHTRDRGTGVPSVRDPDGAGAGAVHQGLVRTGVSGWIVAAVAVVLLVVLERWGRATATVPPPAGSEHEDAERDEGVPLTKTTPPLEGIPAIRQFFRTNETPIYFVSATAFNLLGIDRWVRNFRFLNYYDSFDGWHPNVFVPKELQPREFTSIEEICNYLLGHKEVVDFVGQRGPGGKVAFLMFDEETEQLADELGLQVAFPPASLRHRMDSKIETTKLGNEAGVPSVPNTMGRGTTYVDLLSLARGAGLGDDLVVQTPYGDSGQTTFFIANAKDWEESRRKIEGHDIKVMKRIETRELAIEGVITRHGTLVGPLMTELTGFPELTPYDGGWCGNDVAPEVLTEAQRATARERTKAMGERLRQEGYRGYFELDFLLDADTGEIWLGELNPRVTGASSITNVTAVAYGDMPLFLFHLLEFMDVDYMIDVDALNERWAHPGAVDEWTQFILKQTDEAVESITAAPSSGIWRMAPDRTISYARRDTDWHTIGDPGEAFYLRIAATGGFRYPGADLGILVTRGRFMNDEHELEDRARHWITGIKDQFHSVPFAAEQRPQVEPEPFGFKML